MVSGCNRWLIWIIAILTNSINFGLPFSFGALFLAMMDVFHTDRASAATVQTLFAGFTFSFGIVSGILISKLGLHVVVLISSVVTPLGLLASFLTTDIKVLYFNIGILSATGISLTYIGALVLTERLFTGKQLILCLTLYVTFMGVASVIYPYLMIYLLEQYGLRGTFLVLSGLTCNTFVLSALCWSNKDHLHEREGMQGENSRRHILRNARKVMNKPYICLIIAFALSASPWNVYAGVILDIDAWKRFGDHKVLSLIVFHSCNIVSRFIFGLLKQMKGVNIFVYPILSTICGSIGQLIVYFTTNHAVYLIGTSLSGIAYGGIIASSFSALMKIVKSEQVPVASGLLSTLSGLMTVGAGPLFGNIRDISGSYGNVLVIVVCVEAVAAVFYMLAAVFRRCGKNTMVQNEVVTLSIQHM